MVAPVNKTGAIMTQKYNYGYNPNRTSLSEDEWIAIHQRRYAGWDVEPEEHEDAVDAQPFDAMAQS